jgi:hypothetical protein
MSLKFRRGIVNIFNFISNSKKQLIVFLILMFSPAQILVLRVANYVAVNICFRNSSLKLLIQNFHLT